MKWPAVQALLLIGPTGSGKTPLGAVIEAEGLGRRRCFHFDFGSELRAAAGHPSCARFTQDEHEFVLRVLEEGALLENEHFGIAEKILEGFLCRKGFRKSDLLLLNGMPRHEGQALSMRRTASVSGLIVLDCEAKDVRGRIARNAGGDREGRADDTEEMIRKKLSIFRTRTEPLVAHYQSQGAAVCRIRMGPDSAIAEAYAQVRGFPFDLREV